MALPVTFSPFVPLDTQPFNHHPVKCISEAAGCRNHGDEASHVVDADNDDAAIR